MVIVASAIHKMILSGTIDQGLRWFFGGGMCVMMICLGIMGFLHRSLDKPGTGLLPRWVRLGLRILLGIFFVLFPLFENDSSVLELGVYCAGMGALVLVETVGKIGTLGNVIEPKTDLLAPKEEPNSPYLKGDEGHSTGVEYRSGRKIFSRDELTAFEKGEEDVGGDDSIGTMKMVVIRRGQRESSIKFYRGLVLNIDQQVLDLLHSSLYSATTFLWALGLQENKLALCFQIAYELFVYQAIKNKIE